MTGVFAFETAMDELAEKVGLDPIEVRLKNYAHKYPTTGYPFSSKEPKEAYRHGAKRFGWSERNP